MRFLYKFQRASKAKGRKKNKKQKREKEIPLTRVALPEEILHICREKKPHQTNQRTILQPQKKNPQKKNSPLT